MKLTDFISDVGRPVTYYPELAIAFGGINVAVFICQLIYWKGKQNDPEGWLFKSQEEWRTETGLTSKEQVNARNQCKRLGILEEKRRGVPARLHYKLNTEKLNQLWESRDKIEKSRLENHRKQTEKASSVRHKNKPPSSPLNGNQELRSTENKKSVKRKASSPLNGRQVSRSTENIKGTEITTEITTTAPNGAWHSRLMKFLHAKCGAYPDGGAQGKAVKWLLENKFTVEQCEGCLTDLLSQDWRKGRVTWLTVEKEISNWVRLHQPVSIVRTPAQVEYRRRMDELIEKLGCEVCERAKGYENFPFGKGYVAIPYGNAQPPPCPGCNPRHPNHPSHSQYLEIIALKESA